MGLLGLQVIVFYILHIVQTLMKMGLYYTFSLKQFEK